LPARAFDGPSTRRVVVLSHPNHEAAMFGVLRRLRPRIVILTDGGGEERVAQSRQGLQRIGLLESTTFLDWREADFYDALLDRDVPFFRGVAAQVGREIAGIQA
jgi:hypothetical protein